MTPTKAQVQPTKTVEVKEKQAEVKETVATVHAQLMTEPAKDLGGRPHGALSEVTKLRRDSDKLYQERVLKVTSILFNKQFSAAIGLQYMYKFELRYDKENNPYYSKPILVVSPDEIAYGLQQILKVGEGKTDPDAVSPDVYFNITTKDPDQKVIDSMMDRVFGKAKQQIDISSLGERIGGIAITEEREKEVENMFAIRQHAPEIVDAEVVPEPEPVVAEKPVTPKQDEAKPNTKNNQGGPANA